MIINRLDQYPFAKEVEVCFAAADQGVYAHLDTYGIRGYGKDNGAAFRDLEARFVKIVREKVRIPPHMQRDPTLVSTINTLVDWKRWEVENPICRAMWGQLTRRSRGRIWVKWFLRPSDSQADGMLAERYRHVALDKIKGGHWFKAAIREYEDHVEWDEAPYEVPSPFDKGAIRRAWAAIPVIYANDPNCWPTKGKR